MRNHKLA